MWQAKLFGSLPLLLDWVNEQQFNHDQFKIVVVPPRVWMRRGNLRYYLIYRDDQPATATAALAESAAQDERVVEERAAISTAEEIISSVQSPGRQDPRNEPA